MYQHYSGTATIEFSGNVHAPANDKCMCDVPLWTLQKYNIKILAVTFSLIP